MNVLNASELVKMINFTLRMYNHHMYIRVYRHVTFQGTQGLSGSPGHSYV